MGIYLSVYIKSSQAYRISSIETDAVKTGMGGTLGNKGGTIVTFNLDDTNVYLLILMIDCTNKFPFNIRK